MTQNLCPTCRVPYSAGDQFCIACGSPLPQVEGADVPAAASPTIQLTKPIKTDATGAFVPVPETPQVAAPTDGSGTKSKQPLIIAAAIAVVVIVGLAAGIPAIVRSAQANSYSSGSNSDGSDGDFTLTDGSTSDPVADDVVQSASPGTDETSAPEAPNLPPIYFQSVSGNITCEITVGGVTCQQHNIKYTKPSQACPGGPAGVVIGVEVNGGLIWPCLGGDIPGGTVVNYDVPVNYYGSNCSINLDRGITCTNGDGRGFTMEYERGIQTY